MHSAALLFRTAAAGAAAVVLLTACGGSGDDEPAAATSSSSAPSSSVAPGTTAAPDPEAAAFCSQVTTAFQELQATFGTATPPEIAAALPGAVTRLEQVTAPPEIADDWAAVLDGLRGLTATAQTLDLGTPEGQQQFADAETRAMQDLGGVQGELSSYLVTNCSLGVPTPTS